MRYFWSRWPSTVKVHIDPLSSGSYFFPFGKRSNCTKALQKKVVYAASIPTLRLFIASTENSPVKLAWCNNSTIRPSNFPFLMQPKPYLLFLSPFHRTYPPQSSPVQLLVRSYDRTYHPLLVTSLSVLALSRCLRHLTSTNTRSTTSGHRMFCLEECYMLVRNPTVWVPEEEIRTTKVCAVGKGTLSIWKKILGAPVLDAPVVCLMFRA